ncbi:FAD-dependent oxidoreductase [Dictyobacter arantiisoli]|uniref:FAD/NAD(P)-binding domain-containing protein n=1 Tax=Dictyobacter arantiisoli TaxID=2014874 RepID=A0A5A5TA36_9CHLR|nr:FAD-dependent oxidoreductase [Dictyobacter arantiisoli]GCF08207.1 hypothetical protein KDI_17710 [Dictyobacter arantiisoli]
MNVSLNAKKSQESTPSAQYDVVVLGAGPYGLSVSAHLLGHGLKVATFGKPIYFWRNHMPDGMLLRSYWWATNLSDPQNKYTMARYFTEKSIQPSNPLPRETFIDYGLWFQEHAVPDLDETYISNIERTNEQFRVTLADGRVVLSKSVVMAPGLHYYLYSPAEYAHMPKALVSHSSDYASFTAFKQKKVAVIGAGQGALESAALLHEQGADVTVLCRRSIRWLPVENMKIPALIRAARAPQAGMGNGWMNFLLEKYPYVFQHAPRSRRDHVLDTTHGPAGSVWLKTRLIDKVTIKENARIEKIAAVDEQARITLTTGEILSFDHVILGTGYRPDVKELPMLDQDLKDALRTHRGSPVLSNWFETNIPGLYFLGFSSARSFGPFYRFVVGAGAAARRAANAIAKQVVRSF